MGFYAARPRQAKLPANRQKVADIFWNKVVCPPLADIASTPATIRGAVEEMLVLASLAAPGV